MKRLRISAYHCYVDEHEHSDFPTIINSYSRDKAKNIFYNMVRDVYDNVRFIDCRAKFIGPAHTSSAFLRNANYRGMPDIRCGNRVKTVNGMGYVVGHNSSANFNILFESGDLAGGTYNVHPSEVLFYEHTPEISNADVKAFIEQRRMLRQSSPA